jgi:hypothetical protein
MSLDLKQLYRDFDHTRRLDEFELYVERPQGPARTIFGDLALEPDKHFIFCGSIGSGKSSELAFLGRLLSDSSEPRYFVIGLDAYQSIDEVATLRPAEMLMLIGAAIVRSYEDWWGKPVAREHLEALREAFAGASGGKVEPARVLEGVTLMTWGAATKDLGAIGRGLGGVAGAMGGLLKGKRRAPIGGLTRESAREGDSDVVALLEAVNDLLEWVHEQDGRAPVILVDGLDKIDRVDGLGTIRKLFCAPLLSNINAPCIYTVPITMMLNTEWASASAYFVRKRLSNLVIAAPSKGECGDELIARGRALLREVVDKRLVRRKLAEGEVFDEGALDELITASGGVLRTMVDLVRRSVRATIDRKGERVTVADAHAAIHELAHEFEITMNTARRTELEAIAKCGEPTGSETALELMLTNYVLHYRNGHSWWAPAPLVARIL